MAIDFPTSPSTNDTHTHNGLSWKWDGTSWILQANVESGTTTFTGLTDTPSSFTADKLVKVNSGGSALEFTDAPTSGLPIVNVKDFGAVPGAGGATNRTGIQNAIDSLASTGGLIYIPTGSYAITGTIINRSRCYG
tara:strand:- start:127 stop:534 length:408 start_codon:yes stop_codon:yes gene_type:complete